MKIISRTYVPFSDITGQICFETDQIINNEFKYCYREALGRSSYVSLHGNGLPTVNKVSFEGNCIYSQIFPMSLAKELQPFFNEFDKIFNMANSLYEQILKRRELERIAAEKRAEERERAISDINEFIKIKN